MTFKQLSKNLFYGLLFVSISCFAQDVKDLRPPSIDDDDEIPVVAEDLPLPDQDEDYTIRYFSGVTDGEESRIAIKNVGYILRPAMVQVFTESGDELEVKIVRKNWEEIERSGKTRNGRFENVFKTARQFGIIISGAKKGIEFIVAVSAGHELFPQSTLFVASNTMKKSGDASESMSSSDGTTSDGGSNTLLIILAVVGFVIILLLLFLIFRKRSAINVILALITFSSLNAGVVSSLGGSLSKVASGKGSIGGVLTNIAQNSSDSVLQFYADPNRWENLRLLTTDDRDYEPDMDPRGQPSLPSSCLATAEFSQSRPSNYDSRTSRSRNEGYENNSYTNNTGEHSNSDDSGYSENTNNATFSPNVSGQDKGVFVDGISQGKQSNPIRLPKYDEDGYLDAFGDFPSAPKRIAADRVNDQRYILEQIRQNLDNKGQPKAEVEKAEVDNESVFVVDSGNGTSYALRMPKYDKDGYLQAFGDFPSAPKYVNPERADDEAYILEQTRRNMVNQSGTKPDAKDGNPSNESVFIEGSEVHTSNGLRLPKYDRDGNIESYGDYPQAPKKIDPRKADDAAYILDQIQRNIDNKGEPKDPNNPNSPLTNNQNNESYGDGSSSSQGLETNSQNQNSQASRYESNRNQSQQRDLEEERNTEGCKCLEKAYEDFNHNRYTLEKLKKIGINTKKMTDYGLSFGDNFSGIHGVSGLVWQKERIKILKKIEAFDRTYTNKYRELIDLQYKVLQKIDQCEQLLGEENWYGRHGFMYYEFIKVYYASYK
ncbi:MAG: hypothetical protein AAGL34_07430 [Bacteroidota bacterium]